MEDKDRFYDMLRNNKGQLNEIDLGERMGLNENETQEIIAQLLSEHKIMYLENETCNYKVIKKRKNSR